jgi:hypothetical protein
MPRSRSLAARARDVVTAFYLQSHDFNGLPVDDLARALSASIPATLRAIRTLVRRGAVSAVFGDIHSNVHIRTLPDEPIAKQLEKLTTSTFYCLYPTEATLATIVPADLIADQPFTRRLALGEPQLSFAAFDLAILEPYRNDPRYVFEANDAGGHISITDEYFESADMLERDQVFLQSFGFCYGPTGRRAVGAFLRYLSKLSPEHQRIWHARILTGSYKMHPDYWASAMGHWPEGASVFDAILAEMTFMNSMADAMGRGRLFKSDFSEARPAEFCFLYRPTRRDFDAFVQTLDKMLSENIDLAFFRSEVERETREQRASGEVVLRPKGSITILQEWIGRHFRSKNPAVPELFEALKEVRKLRSHPSHAIRDNMHDESLFETQRELVIRVYRALQTVRLILAYWPATTRCEVPRILRGDTTIWTM